MKFFASFFLLTSLTYAQNTPQINQADIGQIMQKMQSCMAKVDFSALVNLQERSFKIQKDIEKMCAQGQKDKAQSTAVSFSIEVMSYPAIVQLKECSKNSAMGAMLDMTNSHFDKSHVCDGQKVDFGLPNNQRINW